MPSLVSGSPEPMRPCMELITLRPISERRTLRSGHQRRAGTGPEASKDPKMTLAVR